MWRIAVNIPIKSRVYAPLDNAQRSIESGWEPVTNRMREIIPEDEAGTWDRVVWA